MQVLFQRAIRFYLKLKIFRFIYVFLARNDNISARMMQSSGNTDYNLFIIYLLSDTQHIRGQKQLTDMDRFFVGIKIQPGIVGGKK